MYYCRPVTFALLDDRLELWGNDVAEQRINRNDSAQRNERGKSRMLLLSNCAGILPSLCTMYLLFQTSHPARQTQHVFINQGSSRILHKSPHDTSKGPSANPARVFQIVFLPVEPATISGRHSTALRGLESEVRAATPRSRRASRCTRVFRLPNLHPKVPGIGSRLAQQPKMKRR